MQHIHWISRIHWCVRCPGGPAWAGLDLLARCWMWGQRITCWGECITGMLEPSQIDSCKLEELGSEDNWDKSRGNHLETAAEHRAIPEPSWMLLVLFLSVDIWKGGGFLSWGYHRAHYTGYSLTPSGGIGMSGWYGRRLTPSEEAEILIKCLIL